MSVSGCALGPASSDDKKSRASVQKLVSLEECSSIEDVMQAIRVLGVAWFNARLLFGYAGIRDCSLRCQG